MGLSKKRSLTSSPILVVSGKRRCVDGGGRQSPHADRSEKKRVRFATNPNGSIKESERFIEIKRSELDKPNLWYSKKERELILADIECAIEDFKDAELEDESNYSTVFDYCSESPCQETSEYLETAQLHVPSAARGMEWGWASSTETLKRDHVKRLLKVQDQIQGLSGVLKDRVLSSRSLRSSRPGRVMARLLGECDARNEQEQASSSLRE